MWNLTRPVVTPCAESQNYLYLGCPWIDKENVLVRNRVASNCLLSLQLRLRKFFFIFLFAIFCLQVESIVRARVTSSEIQNRLFRVKALSLINFVCFLALYQLLLLLTEPKFLLHVNYLNMIQFIIRWYPRFFLAIRL